jgi:hypothetical protein
MILLVEKDRHSIMDAVREIVGGGDELACGEHRTRRLERASRRYSVDWILGGAVPAALLSAMICFGHSMAYSVKAGTPSSPTP